VVFDPEQQLGDAVLRGYQLVGLTYQPLPKPTWLPDVNLCLQIWEGAYEGRRERWLRWVDESAQPIASGAERAERMAEQLRKLCQEPDF
jgi:hypothetical protein